MGVARGNIKTTLVVDGEQAYFQTMQKLKSQQKAINSEMRALTSTYKDNTSAQTKLRDKAAILEKQIATQKQIVEQLNESYKKEVQSSGESSLATEKLATQYNNASAKLNKLEKELKEVNSELKRHGESWKKVGEFVSEYGEKVENTGKKIESAGKKLSILSGGIAAGAYSAVDAAIDYESAFTGVTKTVDATEEQFDELYKAILQLSDEIPVTASEIAGVAEVAGQLGIKTNDLMDFTSVMIGLGQSTNLSAEEAASSLAKFANVTNMSSKDYQRLGSTIVDLGNNFATTEADIVAMATRLASSGTITGLTQSQILAVATALNSLGIEAEAGGSAFSKLLKKIQIEVETNGKKLKTYASVSNMTVSEFKKLWGKDAVAAIGAFTNGLQDTKRNGKSAIQILDDLKLKEVRLSNAILALSTSKGILTDAVETANNAWSENTALQAETEKRYATLESKIQIVKNKLQEIGITFGEELMPYVENACNWLGELSENFSDLTSEQKESIIKTAAVVAAIGPLVFVFGKVTTATGKLITTGGKLIHTIGKLKTGEAVFQFQKFKNVLAATKGAEEGVAAGSSLLSSSFASGAALCLGLVAVTGLVVGLAAAYKSLTYGSKETRETMNGLGDSIDTFKSKMGEAQSYIDTIKEALKFNEKDVDLEKEYEKTQTKITAIASLAADQRREYTEDEIKRLEELFDKLDEINEKQVEKLLANQKGVITMIENNNNMSAEQMADYMKTAEETAEEAKNSILKLFNEESLKLDQLQGEEREKRKQQINQEKDERLATVQQIQEETYNAVLMNYGKQSELRETMKTEFTKYSEDMLSINSQYMDMEMQNTENNTGASLGNYMNFLIKKKQLNDEFSTEFLEKNSEYVGQYLATVDEMLQKGGTLDDENREIVDAIITAYESMPKSSSKAWSETMDSIIAVIEEQDLKSKGNYLGTSFNQGIEKGLKENMQDVFDTVRGIIRNMLKIGQKEEDAHSPSRKAMWLAKMFDLGLVAGLENSKDDVYKKTSEIVNGVIEHAQVEAEIPLTVSSEKLLASRYASSLASSANMQQVYNRTVNNNYTNTNTYYSSIAQSNGQTVEEIRRFKEDLMYLLGRNFKELDNMITEREAGRIIKKCLKSVSM